MNDCPPLDDSRDKVKDNDSLYTYPSLHSVAEIKHQLQEDKA